MAEHDLELDEGLDPPPPAPIRPYRPALEPVRQAVLRLGRLRSLALAFAGGAVSNLAFAPYHVWPFLAVGLVLAVWLVDGAVTTARPLWAGFSRLFAFGFGFFVLGLSWIGNAFLVDAGSTGGFILLGILVLPAGLALLWGVAGAVMVRFWRETPSRVLVFGLVLFGAELVRGHLFGGFPWNTAGTVWPPGEGVSQGASLVGLWGLTLATLVALASPAALTDARPVGYQGLVGRMSPAVLALAAFAGLWGWGENRVRSEPTTAVGPVVRVVDAGASQAEKWNAEFVTALIRRYAELSGPLLADQQSEGNTAQVVVWPESALPLPLLQTPEVLEAVGFALGERVLVAGTFRSETFRDTERYWNSLAVLDATADRRGPLAVYDKTRLVPFGEFVPEPFAGMLRALGFVSLSQLNNSFTPGEAIYPLETPLLPTFAPLICYEALFAGLVARGPDRPRWIVNVSVDGWFGTGAGPLQHYAQARYRAIEEGLPLVRSASGGVSAVVDAFGREVVRAMPVEEVQPVEGRSGRWIARAGQVALPGAAAAPLYAQFGVWAWGILGLFGLGLAILTGRRR
jgi:apolipoprotein N-acyltransferase